MTISFSNIKTLSDLCKLLNEYDAEEIFAYKASYDHIKDASMHRLKNQYIDARKAISNYLNDESVMDTPLNEARDAEHGWDGITTVRDIALVCQNEGFEYGLLHKSGFLGVDDPIVHQLIRAYSDAHCELLKYLNVDFVQTTPSVFAPMN